MAFKLESAMRIVADVTGTKDVTKLTKAIEGTERAAKDAADGFKAMLSSKAFQAAAIGAAALTAAIGLSTKAAIDFEEKMTGVTKVMGDLSSKEIKAVKNEIIGLSKVVPLAATGIADLFAAGARGGLKGDELSAFAEAAAKVSVAFDVLPEEVGQAMQEIRAALDLPIPKVNELMDAINHLGDNTASSAPKILEFMKKAAASGQAIGLTAEQTAALGAAMTSVGTEAPIAATAMRNLAQRLSAGQSMTNKQIGALERLGIAQEGAADMEIRLTSEVERESNRRIEIARNETDQIAKEINRRYRDQMTALRDNLDDQNYAVAEAIRDRHQSQIKTLQRQMNRELSMARESGVKNTDAIRDSYDSRIDIIRESMRIELRDQRRAARDQLTVVQDRENDKKEIELKENAKRFAEIQTQEKEQKRIAIAEAKKLAEQLAKQVGENMAEEINNDAIGTITKLFEKINQLPKPERLSVITDLLGEQAARGFLPLINNMDNYYEALKLVADGSGKAGSVQREFLAQLNTTAKQMQLAKNSTDALAIAFGEPFSNALKQLAIAITPVINALTWMLTNIPGLAPAIAIVSTAFIGLVAVAAPIAGLVASAKALGISFAVVGAKFAAVKGAIVVGLGVLKGVVVGVFAAVSAPVLAWVALFAVVGTAIYLLRDQIGDVFNWIKEKLSSFVQGAGAVIGGLIQGAIAKGQELAQWFGQLLPQLAQGFTTWAQNLGQSIKTFFTNIVAFVGQAFSNAINSLLQKARDAFRRLLAIFKRRRAAAASSGSSGGSGQSSRGATGGMVSTPTTILAGDAGGEYLVPANKAAAFSRNYLGGVRGAAAIPGGQRFAEGGFTGNANVNITTGPVTQMDGQNFVTTGDMTRAVQQGVSQTLELLSGDMQLRRQLGMT